MAVPGGVAHWTVMSLLLGRVALVAGSEVRGVPGQSITLPCRYSVRESGKCEMCWGRGQCPLSGCGGELIRTDGHRVTSTTSPRYHLGGRIEEGDVSLTINHARREDSGWYCCRVEIPGLFNDLKVDLNLQVSDGRVALVAGSEVRGVPGQSITLPCRYSVRESGKREMCWGRGQCPLSGCGGELIRTDGHTVTSTTSPRYHLGGRIEEGDVSLTINHARREDSGWYCCRVEIPGPFNNLKVNLNLQVSDDFKLTTVMTSLSTSPRGSSSTAVSPVPGELVNNLIFLLPWTARVSAFICFLCITVRLCHWKCSSFISLNKNSIGPRETP